MATVFSTRAHSSHHSDRYIDSAWRMETDLLVGLPLRVIDSSQMMSVGNGVAFDRPSNSCGAGILFAAY